MKIILYNQPGSLEDRTEVLTVTIESGIPYAADQLQLVSDNLVLVGTMLGFKYETLYTCTTDSVSIHVQPEGG